MVVNSKGQDKKVFVVMPAYFAEKTLEKTYREIPAGSCDKVLVVDDGSTDKTVEVAEKLGLQVIRHEQNRGYGGNQKTCYTNALKDGADIVVMLHPDYQYDPKKLPDVVKPLLEDEADVVYGSRMLLRGLAKKGGMPLWKRAGNFFLTAYFNIMVGTDMTDTATGYIAYSRKVLETIPFTLNHNGFCFDEEAIIQCAAHGFRMVEVPIPTRYEQDSSSIGFKKAVKYGLTLFYKVWQYKMTQYKLWKFKQFEVKETTSPVPLHKSSEMKKQEDTGGGEA